MTGRKLKKTKSWLFGKKVKNHSKNK
jgi:hypothetical protein